MKGGALSRWALKALTRPRRVESARPPRPWDPDAVAAVLKPADVLLFEGDQRISAVISYLTTSPWSHAALYLGDLAPGECVSNACRLYGEGPKHLMVEALAEEGVVCSPLAKYRRSLLRICRPRSLDAMDARKVAEYAAAHIGHTYDVDNIFDLLRYFLPAGLVPHRLRREALHFGAGKPTEVICSSLIASAFAQVGYPIFPLNQARERRSWKSRVARIILGRKARILRFRRTPVTLVTPRDFDLSPYFDVVKPPTPEAADYRRLAWETQG